MRVCHLSRGAEWEIQDMLYSFGDYQISREANDKTDVITCWGISEMEAAFEVIKKAPLAKLVVYNWDVYSWVWKRPRAGEYDYKRFGQLLALADEIWCPSQCTIDQMGEWYGEDIRKKGVVVLSNVPIYDNIESFDGDYVLDAMRDLPDDQTGWTEKACKELNIPFKKPNHSLSREEFNKVVAQCTFIVNECREGSTGGLSLMEAYYHGRPGLICDSPYQGGRDYLPNRVNFFKVGDYEDLKAQIKKMWKEKPQVASDHKEFIRTNYSRSAMGKRMYDRLCALFTKKEL